MCESACVCVRVRREGGREGGRGRRRMEDAFEWCSRDNIDRWRGILASNSDDFCNLYWCSVLVF